MRSATSLGAGAGAAGGVGKPDVGAEGPPDVRSDVATDVDSETSMEGPISYVDVGGEDGMDGSGDAGALSKRTLSSSSSATGMPGLPVRAQPLTMNGIRCIRSAVHEEELSSKTQAFILISMKGDERH